MREIKKRGMGERRDRDGDRVETEKARATHNPQRRDRDKEDTEGHWEQVRPRNWRGRGRNENRERVNQLGHEVGERKSQGLSDRRVLNEQQQVFSYYFTIFHANLSLGELNMVFMKWGKVVDLFIPTKRNKQGKQFGFVRFMNVVSPMELEKRLDQIWIGSFKIKVNFMKFGRRSEGKKEQRSDKGVLGQERRLERKVGSNSLEKGVSFAKIVKGDSHKDNRRVWQRKKVVQEE